MQPVIILTLDKNWQHKLVYINKISFKLNQLVLYYFPQQNTRGPMSHGIDLTKLSVDQLIEPNRETVARIKLLRQKESHKALAKLNIGDWVSFYTNMGTIKGIIVKLNKKTATLHTDDHQHWNVSPHLLKKVSDDKKQKSDFSNILCLKPV